MTLAMVHSDIQEAVSKLRFPTRAFIGGCSVDAASGKTFSTENPANGKTIARIAECGVEDVERAVLPNNTVRAGRRKTWLLRLSGQGVSDSHLLAAAIAR